MNQVHARKDKIVKGLTGGIELLFKKNKIDWIKGSGRLAGQGKVEITEGQKQTLTAAQGDHRRHRIDAAQRAGDRDRPQADHHERRSDPPEGDPEVDRDHGQRRRRRRVRVDLPPVRQRGDDHRAAAPHRARSRTRRCRRSSRQSFKKQGIKVLTGTKVTSAKPGADGVDLEAQTPDGKTAKLNAEYLLVATGRGPVTAGPRRRGGRAWRWSAATSASTRSSRRAFAGISAIGDVITFDKPGHPQLAHLSSAEGIALAERIAGQEYRPINYDQVPGCTYCDPEIGSVGLTEKEAQERGYEVKTGSFKFGILARARIAGETEGFVKIVFDKKYDEILGVHMIGPRSTELVAEATLALRLECTVEELMRTIHAHPTMSEAVGEAAHAAHGAPIHA